MWGRGAGEGKGNDVEFMKRYFKNEYGIWRTYTHTYARARMRTHHPPKIKPIIVMMKS